MRSQRRGLAVSLREFLQVDSAGPNEVTAVSIKSGRLALSSAAHPAPVFLDDGAYANESNTVIVILNGRITRVEYGSGTVSQVASIRLQRERVMLTPPVTALMSVSPFVLPSGTFTTQDGSSSFKVVSGRPTEFTVRANSPRGDIEHLAPPALLTAADLR